MDPREKVTIGAEDVPAISAEELLGVQPAGIAPSRVVAAVGIAAAAGQPTRASLYEEAMADAFRKAIAQGIADPGEQRRLMLAAKDKVKDELDEQASRSSG